VSLVELLWIYAWWLPRCAE